jgi:hypothetical protein
MALGASHMTAEPRPIHYADLGSVAALVILATEGRVWNVLKIPK